MLDRHTSVASGLCVGGLLVLLAVHPACAQYNPGFQWSRASEWTPGVQPGSRLHNPGPDALGNPVWGYEVAHGGALGSDYPWYDGPTQVMTWDDVWWESGRGAWSLGDNRNPPVFGNFLTHNTGPANFGSIPLVRWQNPAGDGAVLDMAGTLRVLWTGEDFVGAPTEVDVIIAMFDASAQATSLLLATTVSKAHESLSAGDWAEVPVTIQDLALDAGDSILISARAHDVMAGHWIDLHDDEMSMTLVPAPAAGLIAGAGLLVFRRRRG